MSDPQEVEEWIYLEEELPEIQIREIISIDELLTKNPTLVAIPKEDIYQLLRLLFRETPETADNFFAFHKDFTKTPDVLQEFVKHIVYHVNAKKKDLSANDEEYLHALKDLSRIENYYTRQQKQAELQEPLERAEALEQEGLAVPSMRILVKMAGTEEGTGETVRLETDREHYEILSGELRRANHVASMYLGERIRAPSGIILSQVAVTHKMVQPEDTLLTFSESLLPSLSKVLAEIHEEELSDLRSIYILFQRYGLNMEDLRLGDIHLLVQALRKVDKPEKEEKEEKKKTRAQKMREDELSYVNLHKLFWDSVLHRLSVASDAPLYANLVKQAIDSVLTKPLDGEEYTPLPQQLEKLEQGTMTLEEYIQYLRVMRNQSERKWLSDFRMAVDALQGEEKTTPESRLKQPIQDQADRMTKTIDPDQSDKIFRSKPFLKEYKDPYATKPEIADMELDLAEGVVHELVKDREELVTTMPEMEEDVEIGEGIEEEEEELMSALKPHETSSPTMVHVMSSLSQILMRIQRLTNMPWDPPNFITKLIERAPPVMDIRAAIYKIDATLDMNLVNNITEKSLEDAILILPMEKQKEIERIYKKAQQELQTQRINLFFLFLTYWVLYIQTLILNDLFKYEDIVASSSKAELTGIGIPIKEEEKGVLYYFASILHGEGHDIPGIREIVDDYSKAQLREHIESGFEYFTHEIEDLRKRAHADVVYQGSLRADEAEEAHQMVLNLRNREGGPKLAEVLKLYIKNIQLLPNNPVIPGNVMERKTHVLGCCYVQLNENYLINNRLTKRLRESKEALARYRIGEKDRPLLLYYIPAVPVSPKPKEPIPDEHLDAIKKEEIKEKEETHWMETIRTHSFMRSKIEDILHATNPNLVIQLTNISSEYIRVLYRKDTTLWNNIKTMSVPELYGLFQQLAFDLYIYSNNTKLYDNEKTLIQHGFQEAKEFIQRLQQLEVPSLDMEILQALLLVVICRTACIPGDVEQGTLTISERVSKDFILKISNHMKKTFSRYVKMRMMPTMKEIQENISEMREKQKMETIYKYEQNPELERLVKQARLQGIQLSTEMGEEQPMLDIYQVRAEDDRADFEEELHYQPQSQDRDELDPDALDD